MNSLTLHTILMFIAFAMFVPIATIIARYYKVTPKQDFPNVVDSKFWWHIHLTLMISATVMMTLALYVVLSGQFTSLHGKFGMLTATMVYLQVVSGVLRGSKGSATEWGDHFNMSKRRKAFEFYHKVSGWLILLFSAITIGLGFITTEQWIHLAFFVIMWIAYNYWIADCMGANRHKDSWKAMFGEKK